MTNLCQASYNSTNRQLEPTVPSTSRPPSFREVQDGGTSWLTGSGGSEIPPVTLTTRHRNRRLTALTEAVIYLSKQRIIPRVTPG